MNLRGQLGVQAGRAAYEAASTFIETQQAVRGFRDSDAAADSHSHGPVEIEPFGVSLARGCRFSEPQRTGRAQIDAVHAAIDVEGLGQAAGPASEIEEAIGAPASFHLSDAFQWLEGANEYPASYSRGFRADVEHEVVAVGKINVGVTTLQKHRLCSRGGASIVVGGRVTGRVGLGFDDAPGHAQLGEVTHHDLADQKTSQGHRPDREFRPAQAPDSRPHCSLLRRVLDPRIAHVIDYKTKIQVRVPTPLP
jgi:hypothetical protein